MAYLIDTHCHLDHYYFKDDLDKVVERARQNNVGIIITSGINPETNRNALELASKHDIIKCSLGIYPIDALQREINEDGSSLKPNLFDVEEEIKFIKSKKSKLIAIGEIGLDFQTGTRHEEQKQLFEKLLELAEQIKKPVVIHSRKAEQECIEILESTKLKKVMMHCFSGKLKLVKRIEDNGWFLSIPTNVVFSSHFQEVVKRVNINQLFAETDAPRLSPVKGQRNEPANIIESYKKIAELKGLDLEEVKKNILMNFQRVFM